MWPSKSGSEQAPIVWPLKEGSASAMAHQRDARRFVCALILAGAATGAVAADKLVAELEQRLTRSNVDAVNAHLVAHWSSAMVPLHQQTAACQRPALNLTVRLSRGRHARAAGAHGDALRARGVRGSGAP